MKRCVACHRTKAKHPTKTCLVFRTNDRPLFEFVGGHWPKGQRKEGS